MGDQCKDGSASTLALLGAVSALGVSLGVSFPADGATTTQGTYEKHRPPVLKCSQEKLGPDMRSSHVKLQSDHIKGESQQIKTEALTVKQTTGQDKLHSQTVKIDSAQQKCESQQIKLQSQQIKLKDQ
jgi:hypothetical protein